ncbi:hypothetical protein AB0D49_14300 [Streptomyces sp. NPDC048290]
MGIGVGAGVLGGRAALVTDAALPAVAATHMAKGAGQHVDATGGGRC